MRISFYMFNYVLNDEKFIVSLNNNNEMKIRSCESKENRFEDIIILEEKQDNICFRAKKIISDIKRDFKIYFQTLNRIHEDFKFYKEIA